VKKQSDETSLLPREKALPLSGEKRNGLRIGRFVKIKFLFCRIDEKKFRYFEKMARKRVDKPSLIC